MTLRKVLLVTYHFPPSTASGSFRLLGFARHLADVGWQLLVVAPLSTPWEPTDPELGRLVPADVIVRHAPYPKNPPKIVRALLPTMMWLPRAWPACRAMVRAHHPEAILTSGPPHWVHLLGVRLRR